jgi:NitT/TauT family transport system permease protein
VGARVKESAVPDAAAGTTASKTRRRALGADALRRYALAAASVLAGLALWEVIGRVVIKNALFLATPSQVALELARLWQAGELQHHAWVSTQEFAIGFAIAVALGIPIGLAVAASKRTAIVANPWISGLYATPVIALAPLFILWFGIGIWSKVAVVVSLVVFPVIINTEAGLRNADRQLIEAVRSFGANKMQLFLKVSLPCALPFILAGLRLGVGRGLIGVVVGELFGARAGLGFMITQAAEVFNMPRLFAGVVVLAGAGIVMTGAFQALERRLVPWNYE